MVIYPIKVSSTSNRYRQEINIKNKFELTADEPLNLGGSDAGATPVELVLAGLGSCKAITLQMYTERKGWNLESIDVDISHKKSDRQYQISVSYQYKYKSLASWFSRGIGSYAFAYLWFRKCGIS